MEDVKTTMTVSREGDFTRSHRTEVDEIEYFTGDQNTLTMNQTYTKKFQCKYNLRKYPFDSQVKYRGW